MQRQKDFSEEEKQKIAAMQRPSDMPPDDPCNNIYVHVLSPVTPSENLVLRAEERKRQYSALRRAVVREAKPELVAKFSLATDRERLLGCFPFACSS